MSEISFTVPGNPIPKARPRVVTNAHGVTVAYTPPRTQAWEHEVSRAAVVAMGSRPALRGPVGIEIRFYRADRRRVDVDNLAKAVYDALQGGIAIMDDEQIVECRLTKGVDREQPRAEIKLYPVDGGESGNHP